MNATAILVSGLPGSGKTYFAKRLAPKLGAAYFSSDLLRKTVAPDRTYSLTEKAAVYSEMLDRMSSSLRSAQTIVLDATFYQESVRAQFIKAAQAANSKVLFIEIRANKSTVRERLNRPREDSDANFGVYLKIRDEYQPIKQPHLILHSDKGTVDQMIEEAITWVEAQQ